MLMDTRPPRGSGGDEPWHGEPNRVQWRDASTGYQCLILRGPLGSLCGYVRVPRGHALHGKPYTHRTVYRTANVHGGLSFSGCLGGRLMKRGHWFGFDCAHCFDLVPELRKRFPPLFGQVYRTVDYVRAECTALAEQLAKRKGQR